MKVRLKHREQFPGRSRTELQTMGLFPFTDTGNAEFVDWFYRSNLRWNGGDSECPWYFTGPDPVFFTEPPYDLLVKAFRARVDARRTHADRKEEHWYRHSENVGAMNACLTMLRAVGGAW